MRICTDKVIILSVIFLSIFEFSLSAKQPVRVFSASSFNQEEYQFLRSEMGGHKTIPVMYEKQVLIALSYFPELEDIYIEFRIQPAFTPLETSFYWTGILHGGRQRRYIIIISDSTIKELSPILFWNLDFNAQVGVLGHELSHVADFSSAGFWDLIVIGFNNLSSDKLDHFEFRTDSICIAHGLGYQLFSWSCFVRWALHTSNWEGADHIRDPFMKRERYMNPATIIKQMIFDPLYN